MNTRRALCATAAVFTLTLAACGDGQDPPDPTTTTPTTTAETTSSTAPTTSSETTTETPAPVENPVEPAPDAAPYVTECLEGTPGPAMWSDGTMAYSEDCWLNNGGPAYAEAEGNATEQFWRDNPHLLDQPLGGDPSTWTYDGPRTENGDPEDHPQLNWPSD